MKFRFYSLLILVFVLLLIPIQADAFEFDNSFGLNLMDYSTVNDSGSNFFSFSNTTTINIDIPNSYYTSYVDVVFNVTGGAIPSSIQNKWSSTLNNLTIESLGRGYYRAYGSVRVSTYYSLTLVFTTGNSSSITYIEIISCYVRGNLTFFNVNAQLDYDCAGVTGIEYYYPSNTVPFNTIYIKSDATDYLNQQYQLFAKCNSWSKYDFLDFTFYLHVNSVSSISASFGSQILPISVSYIDNNSQAASDYVFSVRIDLRGIDRSSNDYPLLIVSGDMITSSSMNSFSLLSVGGFISVDMSDPAFPWYMKIYNAIGDQTADVLASFTDVLSYIAEQNTLFSNVANQILAAITNQNSVINVFSDRVDALFSQYFGSDGSGNAIKAEAAESSNNFDSSLGQVNSYERPDSIGINTFLDFSGIVSPTAIKTTTGFLTAVFDVPSLSKLLSLSLIFALAATILFGKKH